MDFMQKVFLRCFIPLKVLKKIQLSKSVHYCVPIGWCPNSQVEIKIPLLYVPKSWVAIMYKCYKGPPTGCMWTLLLYMDAHTCINFLLCQIPGKSNSFNQTKVTAKIGSEPNGACCAMKSKFYKT